MKLFITLLLYLLQGCPDPNAQAVPPGGFRYHLTCYKPNGMRLELESNDIHVYSGTLAIDVVDNGTPTTLVGIGCIVEDRGAK